MASFLEYLLWPTQRHSWKNLHSSITQGLIFCIIRVTGGEVTRDSLRITCGHPRKKYNSELVQKLALLNFLQCLIWTMRNMQINKLVCVSKMKFGWGRKLKRKQHTAWQLVQWKGKYSVKFIIIYHHRLLKPILLLFITNVRNDSKNVIYVLLPLQVED